jgi:hypothetical protein
VAGDCLSSVIDLSSGTYLSIHVSLNAETLVLVDIICDNSWTKRKMAPRKRQHIIYGEIIVSFVGGNVECCVDYYEYDSERSEHACVDIDTICDTVLCEVTNQDAC